MKYSLDISNFLEEISNLSYSIVLLCFFACSLKKAFLSLFAILWNSAFSWVYLSLSPLPFISLLSSVQFSSVTQSCPTLCDPMNRSMLGLPVHHQLLELPKLMCTELVMPSSHFILCRPLLLLPPTPPSIRAFSNESTLRMRWPEYWSFSLYHYM